MNDREVFNYLKGQRIGGVQGVACISSGVPEYNDLVIVGSHGKEIASGLGVVRALMENPNMLVPNTALFIAIGNIEAATMAMATDDPQERLKYRFCPGGRDMNRLPADPAELVGINAPEARRVRDLRRVLLPRKLRYVLDIHSTDGPSQPAGLGIVDKINASTWVFNRLPINSVITNVVPVQAAYGTKTQTLSSILDPDMAVEIEVGQTGTSEAPEVGINVFKAWAKAICILEGPTTTPITAKPTFRMVNSVMAPDTSYQVADKRFLEDQCPINAGEILLRNPDGQVVTAPCSGFGFWGPGELQLTESDVASEVWFIAEKVS